MSIESWQWEWDLTTKGAITKEYFPLVAERLNININIYDTTIKGIQINDRMTLQKKPYLRHYTPAYQ